MLLYHFVSEELTYTNSGRWGSKMRAFDYIHDTLSQLLELSYFIIFFRYW